MTMGTDDDLHRQEASVEDGRIKRDLWGHDVHTNSNRCIAFLNKYYIQVLSYGQNKRVILEAANSDRSCALASALAAAYLWAPQRSNKFSPQMIAYLSAAKANWERASSHEKLVVGALVELIASHHETALTSYFDILAKYPRDLASLKGAQTLCFQMGRTSDMLRIAWQVLDVNAESPYMYGMLSFGLVEVGQVSEAEKFARLALLIEGQDVWAQHAVRAIRHAMRDFLSVLESQSRKEFSFVTNILNATYFAALPCTSARMQVQGSLGLHVQTGRLMEQLLYIHLELGGFHAVDKVLEVFDTRIWGGRPGPRTSQRHIDGLGLLLRLEVRGQSIIIGERILQLADSIKESMAGHEEELLLEVLSVWALSRADELAEAKQKLANIECRTLAVAGHEKEVRQLVTQLASALYEYGRDHYEAVCRTMGPPVMDSFKVLGASNEQLDVFEEMWCACNLRAEHFQRVIEAVKRRTRDRPGVSFSWRLLEEAYSNLGLEAEAKLAAAKAVALEAAANRED